MVSLPMGGVMKLQSVRFLDPPQWKGRALPSATCDELPLLRVEGGFVWLDETTAVPMTSVGQLVTGPTMSPSAAVHALVEPAPPKNKKHR